MVVDLSMLIKFGYQLQKKYIRKVNILIKDLYRSLFDYQAGYQKFTRRVNICIKQGEAEAPDRAK